MGDARNGITARDSHIWTLRMALVILSAVIAALLGVIVLKQNMFTVQVPPDLSHGARVKPGEYLASSSYVFSHYIWRELNDWKVSGKSDLPARLKTYECYVTPSFKKQLDKIKKEKSVNGELDRTRVMTSDVEFKQGYVKELGANTFVAYLHMHIIERIEDSEVKNVHIRYPLRVVPDNRECNRFGQALDGFYSDPERITEDEVKSL